MSYNGQVNFGLVGDYDAMADLDSFALDLEAATEEMIATAPAPKRQRTRVSAAQGNDRLTAEGSFRITEAEIRRLGYGAPVSLPVAANTLVVADTSGFHARGTAAGKTRRLSIWAYSRSNPFLPFTGGDLAGLPIVKDYALRVYWALTDRLKDTGKAPRDWRWVGNRSPLAPPEI